MIKLRSFLRSALPVSLVALLGLTACSDKKDVAGGTEAESTIALQIQLADGSPAAMTRVRMLSEDYMSDGLADAEWIVSDDKGKVKFENVSNGSYTIEARNTSGDNAEGAVTYVTLNSGNEISNVIELGELTTIQGRVAAGQGPSVIRIAGLDRYVVPDSAGYFVIDSLPAGSFDLQIESLSNRGTIKLAAEAGSEVPEVSLGRARGFVVEDFESFTGISATGEILGDGWWYALDAEGKNVMPLWNKDLTRKYSGSEGCASGGCARTENRIGFLLGNADSAYVLPGLDSLMFSARGNGTLRVAVSFGGFGDSTEGGYEMEVELKKVWKGFALAIEDMKPYGKASDKEVKISRIDFKLVDGDTLFLDDVTLDGIDESVVKNVATGNQDHSVYSEDWSAHDALIASAEGYAAGIQGGAGGIICRVTTQEDYIVVDDSTNIDTLGNVGTKVIVAPGSLRDCAMRDTAAWVLFEKSGEYHLGSPLRIASNKTFDGRGRDVQITGTGIMTDGTTEVIFENITFNAPSLYEKDSTMRRAISLHNITSKIWIDHCTFDEYPIYQIDMKRGSFDVTISWSKFQNAETGVLFGLEPNLFKETFQTMTLHHNYFSNMSVSGVFARAGMLHAYNNFFMDVDHYGVECTDSARCYIEKNIFTEDNAVSLYRLWEDGVAVDTTVGFVKMTENWYVNGGKEMISDAFGYKPEYEYAAEAADAKLAWTLKKKTGPR